MKDSSDEKCVFTFGITLDDLYSRIGLERLDGLFMEHLEKADVVLQRHLNQGRYDHEGMDAKSKSELLIAVAPHVQDFIGILFKICTDIAILASKYHALAPLYTCKRLFIRRRALKKITKNEARAFNGLALEEELRTFLGGRFTELDFANAIMAWLDDEEVNAKQLALAACYAAWRSHIDVDSHSANSVEDTNVLFRTPGKIDPLHLVETSSDTCFGLECLRKPNCRPLRRRNGFNLTDQGYSIEQVLDEVNYCIFCHHQNKDSCAHGIKDRKSGSWAKNVLGRYIIGCPLGERISEFQEVLAHGNVVAALALITVDNPMAACTGHRICSDCVAGCIYNNQNCTTVNIPQTETRVIRDVLALPYGFEIYSLLTRWNPLNLCQPLPRPETGRAVLVVGLGPAGYTLSHYLLNDGHTVVAIDGLKIEPLDPELAGVTITGNRVPFRPIRDVNELWEPLTSRVIAGFGGVAEYGITVRWDKNFLKIVRLLLERRAHFALLGGVRMGGTITPESAFDMGFDHIALCSGAGKPTIITMENGLARGVRQASDFLMSLQLTGAARFDSVANLQIRLPIVVIGGGLTAVDATTEALAYYPVQVGKFLSRYEVLAGAKGEAAVRASFSEEESIIADEFLLHARLLRDEQIIATAEGRTPRLWELLDQWGGATLVYRRDLAESPAYRNNHEEVAKAMDEGIRLVERSTPLKVGLDSFGHAETLCLVGPIGDEHVIPARTIIVAAGTVPNTTLASEVGGLNLDGKYFQAVDEDGKPVTPERLAKPTAVHVLTSIREDGCAMSFFGDQHPSFAGSVVAAMASAKQGYPVVSRMLERRVGLPAEGRKELIAYLNDILHPVVYKIERLTPTITEVIVRAPLASRAFRPGQFYRLQNYEMLADTINSTGLVMEGIALTGAQVDVTSGLLSMIVSETGGSSDLVATLQRGEPVVVMGPTGSPTEIPSCSTALLAGGGLGNAVLFSIGRALRNNGAQVLYFAGYKTVTDRYKVDEIKSAADLVVWCCDEAPGFSPDRPEDKAFIGTVVSAMQAYADGQLGKTTIPLDQVDYIIAIGSDGMMNAVREARYSILAPYLVRAPIAIGSINSPMQCMMKGICGQCLQVHRDPGIGSETIVFSCFNQDQPLDCVDFVSLRQRLLQQSTQEKLTRQWIDYCLVRSGYRSQPKFK